MIRAKRNSKKSERGMTSDQDRTHAAAGCQGRRRSPNRRRCCSPTACSSSPPKVRSMFPSRHEGTAQKLMATLAVASTVSAIWNPCCGGGRAGAASRQLRRESGALSGRRRRAAVDAGKGAWRRLDARGRGGLGHGLWHVVRLHDFRSLWPRRGRRIERRTRRERTSGRGRQRHGRRPSCR